MAVNTTVIVNNTQQDLTMQVGNHRYFVHFAKLAKGGKKNLRVDYNDTYQEFLMGGDRTKSPPTSAAITSASPSRKTTANSTSNENLAGAMLPMEVWNMLPTKPAAPASSKKKFSWKF